MVDAGYTALFSGGKDSYLALRRASERGHAIDRLVTVDAPAGSYLYHAPATAATPAIAAALGLEHTIVGLDAVEDGASSTAAATHELTPLAAYLDDRIEREDAPAGVVTGAVASRYQYDCLSSLCAERNLDLVAPLWEMDGQAVLQAMLEAALAVDVVAVAADGLDASWLGRRLDLAAVDELIALAETHGVHPAGEGGEFETLVVDAPAFSAPITYEADRQWAGTHGRLEVTGVRTAESA